MSVGARLKEERERLGQSQTALALACGASKRAQIYFEQDQNIPGGAYLIAAHAQGVDVKYVLVGERGLARTVQPLDVGLLRTCIEAVERYLTGIGHTLAVAPKAALVAECYDEFRARGGATRANVLAFVQRAA